MALLNSSPFRLTIRPVDVQRMRDHVSALGEEEVCGILAVHDGFSMSVYPAINILHRADKFLMDGREQLRILMEIERHGWEIGVIYHSHLFGSPYPSDTDVAENYDKDVPVLIWGKGPDGWMCRAYWIQDQEITPLEIIHNQGSILLTAMV